MLALGALVFPCHPNITILYPEKSKINYGSISFVIMILLRKIGTCRIPLSRNDLELAGLEKQTRFNPCPQKAFPRTILLGT